MNTAEFLKHDISRRQFLGSSAANAAGVAVGMVGVGMAARSESSSAAECVRFGVIGVRSQGLKLAKTFAGLRDVDVAALCDVDEGVLAEAARAVEAEAGQKRPPAMFRDFRRLLDDPTIDAVAVATPDHWHAIMTETACAAGKDVYVESPLTHSPAEAKRIIAAAEDNRRVIQCGLQQRSGGHFRTAVEYVRSGKLGTVRMARAWCVHRRKPIAAKADVPTPAGVDYNLWLGPAPRRSFNPNRFHHNWRWYWDYGTGELGNWGVHLLDVARWGLNVELPERIASTGGNHYFKDDRETPDTQLVHFTYPGRTIVWEHRLWSGHGMEGRSAACAFYGERGTLILDRGGWKVYGGQQTAVEAPSELNEAHCRDFIDSVKSRSIPSADARTADVSSTLCHLGNIAQRVGREVVFDATAGRFPNDAAANALLETRSCKPWG
ncbi:MAG: Gfo/Idh/MocA family protein [Planctomycetaceae bacterium]